MKLIDWATQKFHYLTTNETAVDAIESIATKTTYTASGLTVLSGLTINEWGVVVGMVLGVLTFIFNVWFKMKYKRGK